jgi:hypothetical protein
MQVRLRDRAEAGEFVLNDLQNPLAMAKQMTNEAFTEFPSRSSSRWVRAVLLPAMLAGAFCVFIVPGVSFAAHTKAETETPDSGQPAEAEPAPRPEPAAELKPAVASLATPKGALRAYDAALPAGGLKAAEAAYHCEGDSQRRAAHAMAEVDLATSELQEKVKEKFGPAAVEVILHAARNTSLKDLQEAAEKINGNHATVSWKNNRPPVPMVKVNGKWQVSVSDVLADFGKDADVDAFLQTCGEIATQLRRTTAEFDAGDYPNVTLLERAIQQRFFRLLGEDK